MILIDTMQISLANISMAYKVYGDEINEGYVRHMILNSIRNYNKQYKEEYGELVLCYDGGKNWRKSVFPEYKANRKKNREESSLDWGQIFDWIHGIKDEVRENFPSFMLTKQKQTTALLSWLVSLIRSKSILLYRQIKTLSSYIPLQDLNNLTRSVKDGLLAILPSPLAIKYFMGIKEMAYQIYSRTIKYLSRVADKLLSPRKSTSPGKDLKTLLRYCRGRYLVTISEIKQWWTLRHNRGKSSR